MNRDKLSLFRDVRNSNAMDEENIEAHSTEKSRGKKSEVLEEMCARANFSKTHTLNRLFTPNMFRMQHYIIIRRHVDDMHICNHLHNSCHRKYTRDADLLRDDALQ